MPESLAEPADIYEAMFVLQSDPPVLIKDQEGQVGSQKTTYADYAQALDVILPRLTRLGVLWITAPTLRMVPGPNGSEDPRFVLDWELRHVASKTSMTGSYPLPAGANPMQNGSAISYAKRYALVAVTNTKAEKEDDDGRGYGGRQGMAQRASARQEQARPAVPAAQRAAPAPRPERARPQQQPALPKPAKASGPATEPDKVGPPRNPDAPVSREQQKHIFALFNDLGYDGDVNREARLDICEKLTGRKVASTNNLTMGEAHTVIEGLIRKQEYEARKAAEAKQAKPNNAAPAPARTRREQITGVPDDNAGPAPWEPGDGELATETGGRL